MSERVAEALAVGGCWLLPLAFAAGLCSSLNPCAYPLLGVVAGYVWRYGAHSRRRTLLLCGMFLGGLAVVYGLLGGLGSLLVPVAGLSRQHLMWAVAAVCVVAGACSADLIRLELPSASLLPRYWDRLQGLPGAFVLGMLLGLVATPCATPPLVAIMSLAATGTAVWRGVMLMMVYALGHGLPAIVLGLAAGSLSGLQGLASRGRLLQLLGGWLIIAVGLYLAATA